MSRVSAWWSSLGFGKPASAPEPDFADMGTAFGLDASMDTVPAAYSTLPDGSPEPNRGAVSSRPGSLASR
jgi:hypothetical protein